MMRELSALVRAPPNLRLGLRELLATFRLLLVACSGLPESALEEDFPFTLRM
jgi:hypothetical protein